MKQENIELSDRIAEGVRRAIEKLLNERAAANGTLVISGTDGVVRHVSARELLEKRRLAKG